jgi:hypothetical protein
MPLKRAALSFIRAGCDENKDAYTWIRREVLGFSARMAEKQLICPKVFAAVDQFS